MRPGFPYGPCSHTFPRLPNTTARLQKSRHWFRRDQRPAPQIPNQSCPTGTLNLRHISANQAPARPRKSYIPAKWGGWLAPLARTSSRVCAHLHGYAHTFTAMDARIRHMVTLARPWQHPFSGHAFDETSADGFNRSSSNPTHSNSNVQRLGGMGVRVRHRFAMRRRRRRQRAQDLPARLKAGHCVPARST